MSINYETDPKFRNLVISILKKCKLKTKTIEYILDTPHNGWTGIQLFGACCTHKSIHPINNYEIFEFKGDSTANNCLVWYFAERFPELNDPECVKTLARLKINYGSKKTFFSLAEKLGLWEFISAGTEERITRTKVKRNNMIELVENKTIVDIKQTKKKSLLEDSFEAFIGLIHTLIDIHVKKGFGFKICYNLIKTLYDDMDISLEHSDLYDAKTRLKEYFDKNVKKYGKWSKNNITSRQIKNKHNDYSKWIVDVGYNIQTNCSKLEKLHELLDLYMYDEKLNETISPNHILEFVSDNFSEKNKPSYKFIVLGTGEASLKDDAEQNACEMALKTLQTS